jgi:hypothetical protein
MDTLNMPHPATLHEIKLYEAFGYVFAGQQLASGLGNVLKQVHFISLYGFFPGNLKAGFSKCLKEIIRIGNN